MKPLLTLGLILIFLSSSNGQSIEDNNSVLVNDSKRTIYRSESAGEQEVPEGMIFWNSMDSKDEVENSVWGPNIQQTTYMFPLWGEARIEPAVFGNGLFINHDDAGGQAGDGGNFFAIDNHQMQMSAKQGTIEFLFKFGEDYTYKSTSRPDEIYYAFLFTMNNTLAGRFTADEILDETGLLMQLIWDGRENVRKYLSQIARADLNIWNNGWSTQSENVKFKKGEIAHIAFVWNVNGIKGGTRTSALYINGFVEAFTTGTWPEDSELKNFTYLGAQPSSDYYGSVDHSWSALTGVMDNLKIWNRPLIQQEFIDNAKTFEGFVEWQRMPAIVWDGDTSPEKLGYPKVWTLCDGEISYEYTDSEVGTIMHGKYTGAINIERYWTVTTPCGERAEVIQDIYLMEDLGGMGIKSFTVVDPNRDRDVRELKDLDYWFLSDIWRPNYRVDVHEPSLVESVVMTVKGAVVNVDNEMPYTLGPEKKGDYERFFLKNGVYTICATAYSEDNGMGVAGETKCITLTMHFTLPSDMTANGSLESPTGSYLWDPSATGEAHYQIDANFDKDERTFWGQTTYTFPAGEMMFDGNILNHFYQRNSKATLFWEGSLNGQPGYLMEQRFLYRPRFTLVRMKITLMATGEIVYDSQRGADPWTTPNVVVYNDSYMISEPIRAAINEDWPDEFNELEFGVYPNPFRDQLNISIPLMEAESVSWFITDLRGRRVMQEEAETGTITSIDVSELPQGIYILVMDIGDQVRSFRLVK